MIEDLEHKQDMILSYETELVENQEFIEKEHYILIKERIAQLKEELKDAN